MVDAYAVSVALHRSVLVFLHQDGRGGIITRQANCKSEESCAEEDILLSF